MAEIVGGLFGVTPETLMAQREAALQEQAQKYAQLSPEQAAISGAYMTGGRFGNAIGGLLGAQDPEMMRIQQRQGMLQNLDLTSPESLKQGIQTAMQNKDYQLVSELTNRYQATAKAGLEARKTEADIAAKLGEKLTPEQKNAAGLADGVATRGTPEWTKAYNEQLDKLTTKDVNPYVDNIGVAKGTEQPVYFDKRTNQQFTIQDGKRVAYNGGVDRTTAKVTATADSKGRSAFTEKLGTKDAERVDAAISARDSANQQLEIAARIEAMSPSALSGQFANTRLGMVNFLDTLGLTSPKDKQVLMSSQVLTADSSRLLLAALNNKLGGGISNQDAQRVEQIFPQLENSPEARKELVAIIRRSANKVIGESNNLENYARKNEGLGGYSSSIKLPGLSTANPYSNLSDDELNARIKAAQAAKQR